MTDIDITNNTAFNAPKSGPAQNIKVIGVGGGGNNAVIHMFNQGIKDVSFVLLNTDKQVLDESSIPTKVLIGPGRGAGGKPERARKYAEENAEVIAELFDDNTDMVFITAGMGGGTGTGAAPVVARIAKERGILTVGIVTVPFLFEGKKKVLKAVEGAEEMAKNVDSLLVINNQRLTDIYQSLDIFNAFAKADDTLLTAAQSITDIITHRGVINRDFNDVDSTLREGGSAIISTGYGEGPNRVKAAIEDALHSPLLKDTDIFGSKKLLMVLYVSDNPTDHPFNMEETEELTNFISGIDSEVDVMWGLYKSPDLEDKVKITILASGFEVSIDSGTQQPHQPQSPIPNPAVDDKIADIYGKNSTPAAGARILNPDDYDNPTSDSLKEMDAPAISRRPYGNTLSGNYGSRAFRGTSTPAERTAAKPAPKPERPDNDKMIDFNDLV